MRIGSCIGPYKGMFWLDIASCTITVRKGRSGVMGEVSIPVSHDKMAELMDAMISDDVAARRLKKKDELPEEGEQKVIPLDSRKGSNRKSPV